MTKAFRHIEGDPGSGLLLIADHASNAVPPDVDLGIDPALLDQHMAIDIGVAALGQMLCTRLAMTGVFGAVSRGKEEARPWQVGVLYNRDDRAALPGIAALRAAGLMTGDNEPYSGQVLNATMNTHAEANGIHYLGLEVRQDLIGDDAGVTAWVDMLTPVIIKVRDQVREG